MENKEIALQLTMKALETNSFNKSVLNAATSNTAKGNANTFNAKQIATFYNTVLEKLE